ncbi:MAG: AraC family transcriptional regulator [Flavobacterium sp.]|nr:MAG: AraC family transcriptional regulator [Flavobacterium sp.]
MEQLKNFQRILFQVATHNFEACHSNDTYRGDALPLRMAADLDTSTTLPEFMVLYENYPQLIPFTFVLDHAFFVESCSTDAATSLGYLPIHFLKRSFTDLLAPESDPLWKYIQACSSGKPDFNGTFQLTFRSGRKSLLQAFCTVLRMGNSHMTIVSAILPYTGEVVYADKEIEHNARASQEAIRLEKLYYFILEQLDKPLPSAYELARMLGTNDHALKEGFRKAFGTSIYQFYMSEKLKRARLLIEQSTIPLHKIAADMGFGTYGNFSRAFHKKYKHPPSEVKRWDQLQDDNETGR